MKTRILTLFSVLCYSTFAFSQNVTPEESIFSATSKGDLQEVKKIISQNKKLIFAKDSTRQTPLHVAAEKNFVDIVKFLIEKGADVNAKNQRGATPLHLACQNGRLRTAELLVRFGASVQEPTFSPARTPIHYAAFSGNIELVEFLVQNGERYTQLSGEGATLILWAAKGGSVKMLEFLLLNGQKLFVTDDEKNNALHWACAGGNIEMVKFLISQGIVPKATNRHNFAPIQTAVVSENFEVVKFFLENKIYSITDRFGCNDGTILHELAFSGNIEMLEYCLKMGADVNVLDKDESTPLTLAARSGNIKNADFLLKNGAEINTRKCVKNAVVCRNFETPLHAAIYGEVEMLNFLLSKKAEIDATNGLEQTTLHLALQQDNQKIVEFLISQNANVNFRDKWGKMPLHYAVMSGKINYVVLLLENKAAIDEADNEGRTPLHWATILGYSDIVNLLISRKAKTSLSDKAGHSPSYFANFCGNNHLSKYFEKTDAVIDVAKGKERFLQLQKFSVNKKNDAYIFYLRHSGFAVKTKNHFLIFDYTEEGRKPDNPCIFNGFINPDELQNENVLVFVSHEHYDHYSQKIWEWKKKVKKINYILGFSPDESEVSYTLANKSGETYKVEGAEILSINSNEAGMTFVVKVDGVTIFFAGDHSNANLDIEKSDFSPVIEKVAESVKKIDIAFLPIEGCGFGVQEAVRLGVYYALKKLSPQIFIPMHATQNEIYRDFWEIMQKNNAQMSQQMWFPEFFGDRMMFKNGKIESDE